jgi:hypothetical protein
VEPLTPDDPIAVGPFALSGRLGAGGMGTVYLGQDSDGRRAAVKVVHHHLAADPEFRARFGREIALARSVDEPWAARLVAADPEALHPWLATEYVDGPDLDGHVAAEGPLPVPVVVRLGSILAGALADLHRRGIVHRDLKPANVLLAADGARLIDFGIARAVDTTRITHTGMMIGTPAYMAPEQADGQDPSPASDVFSLGSVLVFAATGAGPFGTTSNPVAMLVRISRDDPDLTGVPDRLRPVLAACLARDPAARPTAGVLARRFGAAAANGPAPTLVAPPTEPVPVRDRRTRWTMVAAGIALVGLAAAAIGFATIPAGTASGSGTTSIPVVADGGIAQGSNLAGLALSPGGHSAAVGGLGEVALVDLDTKTVRRFPGATAGATRVLGWSADGGTLYADDIAGRAGVQPIDPRTGVIGPAIDGTNGTTHAAISPDGRTGWFARPGYLGSPTGGDEGTYSIKQVDLVAHRVLATVALPFAVTHIALDTDDEVLYVVGPDRGTAIRAWAMPDQKAVPFALTRYEQLLASSTGRVVAVGSRSPGLPVLAVLDGADHLSTINVGSDIDIARHPPVGALAPGGGHAFLPCRAGSCDDGAGFAVGVVEVLTGRQVGVLTAAAPLTGLAVTPDGKRLVGADVAGNIVVLDTSNYAS